MFRNISDVLKSSAEVLEKRNVNGDKSKWRSLDIKKVTASDGRRVYKLVEVKGFFSYLVNHVKYLFFASDYKKSMEEELNTPKVEKNLKDRRVADISVEVFPSVRNTQDKEVSPTIARLQETSNQKTFSTHHTADSDYETASDISDGSDLLSVDENEHPYDARRTDDDGYAEGPESYLSHASIVGGIPLGDETPDYQLQQALERSRKTEVTDQERRNAIEQKNTEEAIRRSLEPGISTAKEDDPDISIAIALSKNADAVYQENIARQERKATAILQKYNRDFVQTVRDGDCFYDGMTKLRGHSNIMALRNRSHQEGKKCLEGNGKLHFDPEIAFLFEEQIDLLKQQGNYAEQLDIRLMAANENCKIVVCDLNEKVSSIVGPDGELEEYPEKSLNEVMRQYPDAELFVLDTQDRHYMTGRKK